MSAARGIDGANASATPLSPPLPGARRSLVLAAIGALSGLIVAGFGLFTAQGTRTSSTPAEDVALVNGVPILRVDFIAQLRALHDASFSQASLVQKRALLDDMIADELAVQRGVELGMPTDDTDTRSALAAAVRGQLATEIFAAVPEETELRRYYLNHRERYASEGRMTLHWLVLPADAGAQAISAVAALRKGVPLEQVVATYHLRSTGKVDDGAEYYFAAAIHLGPKLFDLARTLGDGAVSNPVPGANGLDILVMQHNQAPVAQGFDAARNRVREDEARDRLAAIEAANARFLRKRADIVIASDLR